MKLFNVFVKLSTEELRVLAEAEHSSLHTELRNRAIKRYHDGDCSPPTKEERKWFNSGWRDGSDEFLPDYLICREYTTYHAMAVHKYSERIGVPLDEAYQILMADRDNKREVKP